MLAFALLRCIKILQCKTMFRSFVHSIKEHQKIFQLMCVEDHNGVTAMNVKVVYVS